MNHLGITLAYPVHVGSILPNKRSTKNRRTINEPPWNQPVLPYPGGVGAALGGLVVVVVGRVGGRLRVVADETGTVEVGPQEVGSPCSNNKCNTTCQGLETQHEQSNNTTCQVLSLTQLDQSNNTTCQGLETQHEQSNNTTCQGLETQHEQSNNTTCLGLSLTQLDQSNNTTCQGLETHLEQSNNTTCQGFRDTTRTT